MSFSGNLGEKIFSWDKTFEKSVEFVVGIENQGIGVTGKRLKKGKLLDNMNLFK